MPSDGGSAFPVISDPSMAVASYGMSLRDYFAAQIMSVALANYSGLDSIQRAEFAYLQADAMLAEREKASQSSQD